MQRDPAVCCKKFEETSWISILKFRRDDGYKGQKNHVQTQMGVADNGNAV